jgi:hypothetical protein
MGGYGRSSLDRIRYDGAPRKDNLLKWKRKAERYLMRRAFFTIVHAGPLTDNPGGQKEVVWDTDDALLRTNFKKISKEDCAEVLVQALLWKESVGRNIDVGSRPIQATSGDGGGGGISGAKGFKQDWLRFWSRPGNNAYPANDQV